MKSPALPPNWRVATLDELAAKVPNAIVDGPFGSNLKLSDYVEEGVPVLQGQNITHDTFRWSNVRFISSRKANELKRSSVRTGDILLVKIGSIGYSAIIPDLQGFESAIIPANLAKITPHPELVDTRYLHKWMTSPDTKNYLVSAASKTAQPALSLSKIKKLPVPIPPLVEQRRIADVLDRAETLRAKRREALAQLDNLSQAIFLEIFGDPKLNKKAFPEVAMGSLFSAPPIFGTMISPSVSGGEWVSIRVANIQNWQLDLRDEKYVALQPGMIARHSVKDGDLLMARAIASQDHLGKAIIAYPGSRKWAFDSHVMRLRFDPTLAQPEFIRHLLMTTGGRQLFLKASRRSAVQFNINTKEIKKLRIPIPPLSLQNDFARRVANVEKLKAVYRASLAELDVLFASLQYRAFRGEL